MIIMVKKCPRCNSTRISKEIIDGELVIYCLKCGFVNKCKIPK